MDRIKEMMDSLSELSDEQIADLQTEIISEFETVESEEPTPQTVDAMTSLADMLDTVRTEVKRREAAAVELAQAAAEAATRVYGQSETEDGGMDEGNEEPMEEAPAPADDMTEEVMEEVVEVVAEPEAEEPAAEEPAEPAEEEDDKEEEEEDKMKKPTEASIEESPVAEASAAVDETSELSTEEELTTETPVEAEAATETEPEAEAAVEVETAAEAAVEVVEEAEAAAETVTAAAETEEETPEAHAALEVMEAPVTAAAENADLNIEVPADRRPTPESTAAVVAITAGADIPGFTAGSPLSDMTEVADAMVRRLHGLRNVKGGDGDQHIVASLVTAYPQERILTQDPEGNAAKIDSVVGPEALVASGGHSTPFEVRYDIFSFGSAARPVRDSLPRFQADRGGIRYIVPPVLADYDNAVGIWTAATDADPQSATKTNLVIAAATETTVSTDAVTLQMQFGNMVTRAYPELVARHNELGLIRHAREAEQNLLSKIGDASTAVTTSSLIGVARDYLVQVSRAAAAYRSRHRLDADTPLRVIAPAWVKDAMQSDLALAMPGDSTLAASDAEVEGYLAARNVNVTWTIDGNVFGSQSTGALNEFGDTFVWYMFAEGTFLFLDGGTLDIGIIRDSTLVGTNDYRMFIETFENVAKVGVESLKVTSTISVNGAAAALRDTTGGATAAAIEL